MENDTELSVKQAMTRVAAANGRKRLKRVLLGSGVLLLIVAATALIGWPGAKQVTSYQTRPVKTGDLEITVTATGNLEATNQVEVGSELSGIITKVTVDYNDQVKLGQPLAYLDDTKIKATVAKSRAEVSSAKAKYQEALATRNAAEKTLQRYRKTRELTNGKLPSLENLDQAEAELERSVASLEAASAAIEIAEATLRSNETDLEKTTIYSPINGVVLTRAVEPGQTVAASLQAPVLFTLAEDLSSMELQVDVDEADVGQVKQGQRARFSVDAYPDRQFEAQITQVRYGAETTNNVVTYKTVLRVDNRDLLLRPGMTATADIIVRQVEKTLLVPSSALRFSPSAGTSEVKQQRSLLSSLLPGPPRRQRSNAGSGEAGGKSDRPERVYILAENGQPTEISVKKIASDGSMTAVSSERLRDGMAVVTNETVSAQ